MSASERPADVPGYPDGDGAPTPSERIPPGLLRDLTTAVTDELMILGLDPLSDACYDEYLRSLTQKLNDAGYFPTEHELLTTLRPMVGRWGADIRGRRALREIQKLGEEFDELWERLQDMRSEAEDGFVDPDEAERVLGGLCSRYERMDALREKHPGVAVENLPSTEVMRTLASMHRQIVEIRADRERNQRLTVRAALRPKPADPPVARCDRCHKKPVRIRVEDVGYCKRCARERGIVVRGKIV